MKHNERELLELFQQLDETRQAGLLDYALFLVERAGGAGERELALPLDIPRPENESVVKAIKRLRSQYPMLEAGKLLNDTSNQMTRHMIHGVPAHEVIDELEQLFRNHYDTFVQRFHARD